MLAQTKGAGMPYALGLDIGEKHNGVAIVDANTRELIDTEICDVARFLPQIEKLDPNECVVVGIEKFLLYPWAGKSQTWKTFKNIELIGITKYLLAQKQIPYVEVKAVQSKNIYSKERLKDLGYNITKDPYDHKRDALSSALYALDRMRTKSNRVIQTSYIEAYQKAARRG